MTALSAAYPRDNFIPNETAFNLWYSALHDIDYPTLKRAAQSYIMANKFPPTIADIRQLAYDLDAPADALAAEEWARLMKAQGSGTYPKPGDSRYICAGSIIYTQAGRKRSTETTKPA